MAFKAEPEGTLPEYNGWTNFGTWAVWCHLTNDQYLHNRLIEFSLTDPSVDQIKTFVRSKAFYGSPSCHMAIDLQEWARRYNHRSIEWSYAQIDWEGLKRHMAEFREEVELKEVA